MCNFVRWTLLVIVLISAHRPLRAAEAPVHMQTNTGVLTYPAFDNLDLREGTIECWVKLGFEPADVLPAKEYKGFVTLFTLEGQGAGMKLHYMAWAGKEQPMWFLSMSPNTYFTGFNGEHVHFRKGEWHHIALTWNGPRTEIFVDGKLAGSAAHRISIFKGFEPAGIKQILIGDPLGRNAIITLDDVRLSRVARRPEELGFHGELQPDVYTSILDPFEADFEPDGKELTQPSFMLSGEGGLPSAACQYVEGKFGKGLSFYKQ